MSPAGIHFGRLWRCGHETFAPEARRILSVTGAGATNYLQGLVTCDLLNPPTPPRQEEGPQQGEEAAAAAPPDMGAENMFSDQLRAACFLDNKGRILTDSLLWKVDETQYYIDVPGGESADQLLAHLKQFILRRSKVKVQDTSDSMGSHVIYGTLNAQGTPEGYLAHLDPRHPSLGIRVLSLDASPRDHFETLMSSSPFPNSMHGTFEVLRKFAGVAEGVEIHRKIAGETNQEFLNAVSFRKGCYLGQELTARVQYTGAIRKRVMPLLMMDLNMEIPRPWLLASQVQSGRLEVPDDAEKSHHLARLPRLSATGVANWVGIMSGNIQGTTEEKKEDEEETQNEASLREQLKAQSEALYEEMQSYSKGDKIVDTKDGKTIGQVVATPAEGTNVLLAQMRLDRVGLLGSGMNKDGQPQWSPTNKITIGDSDNQLRYLPYLPLWWPEIDPDSGKAKEQS